MALRALTARGVPPALRRTALPFSPVVARMFSNKNVQAKFEGGAFRSNAEELIAKVGVVEVEGMVAVCNGGGGALGHPVEYIQLNTVKPGDIGECKYCGLRFVHKSHH
mmetsp:Transcript_2039/g.4336  ORF Transcript_2039/g.4336 Transcript_2039/m.4336 type:complete len:108 (+) Transcript_2039:111-434(+)